MKKWDFILFLLLAWLLFSCCDRFFPTQSKPYVPGDHDLGIQGFLHKQGLYHPLDETTGCSAIGCHGADLRGSVAVVNGRRIATRSCYGCHGAIWEGGEGEDGEED